MGTGGWGGGPYGPGPWGGGGPFAPGGPMALAWAYASTTRTVVVATTAPALALDAAATGDALNPLTWHMSRTDTGEVFLLLSVRQIDPVTFEVLTLKRIGPYGVTHKIEAPTLLDNSSALISAPTFVQFDGMGQTRESGRKSVLVDLHNPATPDANNLAGSLQVTGAGEYAGVSGVDFLRKMILRRMVTDPGEFMHIPKDEFGLGLKPKGLLLAGDDAQLEAAVVRQVLREPEVSTASAQVRIVDGATIIRIRARLHKTGQSVEFDVAPPVGAVSL